MTDADAPDVHIEPADRQPPVRAADLAEEAERDHAARGTGTLPDAPADGETHLPASEAPDGDAAARTAAGQEDAVDRALTRMPPG